jgi:formate-dependent nitrite reductase cytochrome c552 subunit
MRRRPTEEEIAARAYELYEQHGEVQGRALDDWLQAKAELEAAETSAESKEVLSKPRRAQSRRGDKARERK